MGLASFFCAGLYENRLEQRGKSDILYLLIFLSSIARAFVFLFRAKDDVLAQRDPGRMAKYEQPHDSPPVYWQRKHGLEDRLVRSNDLVLHKCLVVCSCMVAVTQAD